LISPNNFYFMKAKLMFILPMIVVGIFINELSYSQHPLLIGTVKTIDTPAGINSSEPNLHKSVDGKIYLSWIENDQKGHTILYFSTIKNSEWSKPVKISEGANWFVNWADFPSFTSMGNEIFASHYLVESEGGNYAYDINVAISNDAGATWSKPITPHTDNTQTEHGFVSMVPYNDKFMVVWLDGRNYAGGEQGHGSATKEMTLRSAAISKSGVISQESVLDDRVCDCCQTDITVAASGPVAVYRNRSENEIRDISLVRYMNGKWTEPRIVAADNWQIAGCPVNGPAIDSRENTLAVAWFTAAGDGSKVKTIFSSDGGKSFGKPLTVSDTNPWGRVDVALLNNESALVCWLDNDGDDAVIKVRRVHKNGLLDEPVIVAKSSGDRSSGFPKMVVKENTVYFAWTDSKNSLKVKTALIILR
jgi:hypothetical protein